MPTPSVQPDLREVTPPGFPVEVWEPTVRRATTVDLPQLLARVGAPDATELVLVAAHPDDETVGAGRLAAAWSQVGATTAVLGTLGEACLDHVQPRLAGLPERRLAEWQLATSRLGVDRRTVLALPDSRLTETADELVAGLDRVVTALADRPGRVVLAAPWAHDPHPDHQAAGRAAATVARRHGAAVLGYPVWTTSWLSPDVLDQTGTELLRLATDETAEQVRLAALDCYGSQLLPLADHLGPVVPPELLDHHRWQLVLLEPMTDR